MAYRLSPRLRRGVLAALLLAALGVWKGVELLAALLLCILAR